MMTYEHGCMQKCRAQLVHLNILEFEFKLKFDPVGKRDEPILTNRASIAAHKQLGLFIGPNN